MATISRSRDPRTTSDANLLTITGEEVNTLRLKAVAVLDKKNPEQYATEQFAIEEASLGAYGDPATALCNAIKHLTNHSAKVIFRTYADATQAGLPEKVMLTDEHITVRAALSSHYSGLLVDGEISSHDKASYKGYQSIMSYALKHIEEGHLIASLYVDRGMRTLQEILDFLPTLRTTRHPALTEGTL